MAGITRRLNGGLSALFPEKRLFIQSGARTRTLRLTPLTQLGISTVALAAAGGVVLAAAVVALDFVASDGRATGSVVIHDAYKTRLEELAAERDQRAAEARSAQGRFQVAMEQISRQQTAMLRSVEERRELATALDLMRARVQEAVAQRDSIASANDELLARMNELSATLNRDGASGADLAATLATVSEALAEAVAARDTATGERAALVRELADLELRVRMNAKLQDEMVEELEQAVALSFGPLEELFETTGLDVDHLIATVRRTHTGSGGPLGAASVSTRNFDDPELTSRFDKLMIDLDRMNLLRIAAGSVPYAMPVKSGYRFTSGFGRRGGRMHNGIDLAAPSGTPIYAAADGVVKSAARESGYGNVVRIRHEFGFETVYAHQSKIRVRPGQTVSRGEQIGDMGSTGRSTGVHLHYEVRLNGQPMNPMTYLEAAKDVFEAPTDRTGAATVADAAHGHD
jgi:murein DD-endopeptidase MepM/ murein hydrolase activator NlpD